MDEQRHVELLRAVVETQNSIIEYLTERDGDEGPSYRTMAELHSQQSTDDERSN